MLQTPRFSRSALRCLLLTSAALLVPACSSEGGGTGRDGGMTTRDSGTVVVGPGGECTDADSCLASGDGSGLACLGGRCGCLVDEDCGGSVCDPGSHACAACVTASHCTDPDRPVCAGYGCVQCVSSSDCAGSPHGAVCVDTYCSCASDTDCPSDAHCGGSTCEADCGSDADCGGDGRPLCDTNLGRCVECITGADCVANGMATDGTGAACLGGLCGCSTSADCAGNAAGQSCHPFFSVCFP